MQRAAAAHIRKLPLAPISIHALVQRAACQSALAGRPVTGFQSTPSCRGRRGRRALGIGDLYFNPRPRAEGGKGCDEPFVSSFVFQSTPSCRGRLAPPLCQAYTYLFQSTPSCRGRLTPSVDTSILSDFNPRPRAEGGPMIIQMSSNTSISIHALVQRAAASPQSVQL